MEKLARNLLLTGFMLACLMCPQSNAIAQAPAAAGSEPSPMNGAALYVLVGPIALYPDDLIAIILPASTYPLEIVQADRFLAQRKADPNVPVNEAWHDSVKALLNYPEVVRQMSNDLDWTVSLGEAVVADQGAVLEAVQRFRRHTNTAGNLKSDDKQTVVVENEVIRIVPSNPEVIYVPQYNPSTVVVSSPYPPYTYWPAPYPVYYYPYAPGAAFAAGLIWGAAITAAWNGGHYVTHYGGNNTININRDQNVNRGEGNRGNAGTGETARGNRQSGQSSAWRSEKRPGQVSGGAQRGSVQRVGDASPRAGAGTAGSIGNRQAGSQIGGSGGPGAGNAGGFQGRGGDAFSGYGSARDAQMNSSRGAQSRQSTSSGRNQFQGGRTGGFSQGGGRSFGGGRGGRR